MASPERSNPPIPFTFRHRSVAVSSAMAFPMNPANSSVAQSSRLARRSRSVNRRQTGREMSDIVERVAHLGWEEWSSSPVGQRLTLTHPVPEQLLDKSGVPDRVAESDQPGCELNVKHSGWGFPGSEEAKPDIFTAGVDNNRPGRVGHDLPEPIERTARERVNHEQVIGGCDLDQAEFGAVGILPDKFGVKPENGRPGEVVEATGLTGPVE
jgi:hypothetical protein